MAAKGDVTTVKVVVDTAKKKRFEALLGDMQSSKREEAGGFDAYWEAVGEILSGELYIAGGFATAEAFVRATVNMPLRSALRNVRVARHASPAEEARFGTALLDAALAFIEAKAGGPVGGPLPAAFEKLRIPVEGAAKGAAKTILLADATVEQVRAATRALLAGDKKASSKRSAAEQAIVTALHATSALRSVQVSVRDGKVRIGAFPVASLGELGRALVGVRLPVVKQSVTGPKGAKNGGVSAVKKGTTAKKREKP